MKQLLSTSILLCSLTIGCNSNKEYTRTVTLSQSNYLQAPELQVDLSQIPADWVTERSTVKSWGNIEERIKFASAHGKQMKIVIVPLDKPINVKE